MGKINVLVIPSDTQGGVGFFRSTQPHIQLEKQYPDDFSVTIEARPSFDDLTKFDKYDIIHIHKGLFQNMTQFWNAMTYFKGKNITTIIDVDDNWKLHQNHPQYLSNKIYHLDNLIKQSLSKADYVTTTTSIFADQIKPINKNVHIFPNAIDPTDPRFQINRPKSDKLRVGFIMGSSHEKDMEIMSDFVGKLSSDTLSKIQLVLCGFDTRGTVRMINPQTHESKTRNIKPEESVWAKYEVMVTKNYKLTSPMYEAFLKTYVPNSEWPNVENETYKRCWTKDIDHYYQHYNEVDVLLAPLAINDFNKVKSQLKVIECGFSHTALIASDFGPYQLDLVNAIQKGGDINPEGNALLVDEKKNHKLWAKYIEKLANNPELVKQLQDNIQKTAQEKFDLRKITEERAEFYKSIVRK